MILFLALDQGTTFASSAAQAIMMGIASVGLFCLTYSWLARYWTWLPTALAAWLIVLLSTFVLEQVNVPLVLGFVGIVLVLGVVLKLLPRTTGPHSVVVAPRWEIPVRMVVATAFVLALTELAALLGPHLSGLLAPFPIFASILGIFTHRFSGAPAAGNLLRGVVLGSFSFAAFFLVIAAMLKPAGIFLAFACATVVALAMHGISLQILSRHPWGGDNSTLAAPGP